MNKLPLLSRRWATQNVMVASHLTRRRRSDLRGIQCTKRPVLKSCIRCKSLRHWWHIHQSAICGRYLWWRTAGVLCRLYVWRFWSYANGFAWVFISLHYLYTDRWSRNYERSEPCLQDGGWNDHKCHCRTSKVEGGCTWHTNICSCAEKRDSSFVRHSIFVKVRVSWAKGLILTMYLHRQLPYLAISARLRLTIKFTRVALSLPMAIDRAIEAEDAERQRRRAAHAAAGLEDGPTSANGQLGKRSSILGPKIGGVVNFLVVALEKSESVL